MKYNIKLCRDLELGDRVVRPTDKGFTISTVITYEQYRGMGSFNFGEYGLVRFQDEVDSKRIYYANLPMVVLGNEKLTS